MEQEGRMNSEQLKKSKEILRDMRRIDAMLKRKNMSSYRVLESLPPRFSHTKEKAVYVSRSILEPALTLIEYKNSLLEELKELGYED
jgi:hypothetical protein